MVCGDYDFYLPISHLEFFEWIYVFVFIFSQSEFRTNVLGNLYLVLLFFCLGLGFRFLCSVSEKA